MDALAGLYSGFQNAFTPQNIYLCFIGCLWGSMVGVLPGIGPLAGITLLIPITYGIEPTGAIIMLAGIYYGAMYGGSTTSILLNIPGESASVVTCLDGYQMTLKGRAGAALFIAAIGSLIGGTISIVGVMLLSPVLADIAAKFGPGELFALLMVALLLLGSLGTGSFLKTMAMIIMGMLAGTVGMDTLTGAYRLTHGLMDLYDGLGFVPVAMGMFGIGEILSTTEQSATREVYRPRLRELLTTWDEFRSSLGPILRGSFLGFFIGLLPGAAHILSSFMSYTVEKRLSKKPEEFGTGRIEGVAGPETANNAATGSYDSLPCLGNTHYSRCCGHDDRAFDPRDTPRPSFHFRKSGIVLDFDCQHVYWKHYLSAAQSSVDRHIRQHAASSLRHSLPDYPFYLSDRHLFS